MLMMAKELPEDLVIQILVWLPVVSLLRFKSVCKSWYALITNQNFITKHLLHNKNINTQLLLKTRDKTTEDYVVSTISYETLQVSRTHPLPPECLGIDKISIFVAGSCNGLVCLHDYRSVIWNPATKETKVVPKSNLPRIVPAGYLTRIDNMSFGFDAKTNDYKIIHFVRIYDPWSEYYEPYNRGVIHQKEVYSLRADSWRKVDGPPCFLSTFDVGSRIYINGMASWLAYENDCKVFVLSFDMSDEAFLKTPLPDTYREGGEELFVLNELIAITIPMTIDEQYFELIYDIWVLLEIGVKDSWTKLFTIGPFIQINDIGWPGPLGFWKNDLMLIVKSDGQLALYDPSSKQLTNLQIHGDIMCFQLVTYMETLVSVKGGNEFEEQDNC
ncbi:F-box/kelch-repeat protein At3g23880-like [Alnus glutinosa]|uniref:F-box/kelch-repeat protein At3g23880-like n=1 Tax=Alnus glutinosa TaxID=3517 RepID=UPI002D78E5F6|nr:F-box/kelch-repeat protein At3g23880-like [Alnus glutinosa]